jgi:phage terminase small subunit
MERRSNLKLKRSRFIDEYILSFDGKAAAIKAGYSEHTAKVIASQLLANAEVKAEFEIRYAAYKKKNEVRREKVLDKLNKLVERCEEDDDRTHLIKSLDMMNKMAGQYVHTVITTTNEQPLFPE